MDRLLAALVSNFEVCKADGLEVVCSLTIFAGGMRFDGVLLTFEEFERTSSDMLRGTWNGIESATFQGASEQGLPMGELRKDGRAVDPVAGSLHLAVSRAFAGPMEFKYSPPQSMRFMLASVAGWTTARVETSG